MKLQELPLKIMNSHISEPNQDALEFLEGIGIPGYIINKYPGIEDRADAFDGAFEAYHIHAHLSRKGNRQYWLDELLFWYDSMEHRFKGPFFDGLHATLISCGFESFYKEAIDYILRQEGRAD